MSQERIVVLSWNLHWNILALFDLSKVNGISNFQSFRPANVCQQLSSSPKKGGWLEKIIKQQIVVLKLSLAIVHLVKIIKLRKLQFMTIHEKFPETWELLLHPALSPAHNESPTNENFMILQLISKLYEQRKLENA